MAAREALKESQLTKAKGDENENEIGFYTILVASTSPLYLTLPSFLVTPSTQFQF